MLGTIAADTTEPAKVDAAYASLAALQRELADLKGAHGAFAGALEAARTRSDLADLKQRLEAHQRELAAWEESLGQQLERVSELQT